MEARPAPDPAARTRGHGRPRALRAQTAARQPATGAPRPVPPRRVRPDGPDEPRAGTPALTARSGRRAAGLPARRRARPALTAGRPPGLAPRSSGAPARRGSTPGGRALRCLRSPGGDSSGGPGRAGPPRAEPSRRRPPPTAPQDPGPQRVQALRSPRRAAPPSEGHFGSTLVERRSLQR